MAGSLAACTRYEGVDITPSPRRAVLGIGEKHKSNTTEKCSDCKIELTGAN
jgi:hypothetical protein